MKIELDKTEALRILEILHDLHKMTMDDLADPKVVGTLQAKAFTSALDVRESLNKAYVKLHA
jgi:hypothetical protein